MANFNTVLATLTTRRRDCTLTIYDDRKGQKTFEEHALPLFRFLTKASNLRSLTMHDQYNALTEPRNASNPTPLDVLALFEQVGLYSLPNLRTLRAGQGLGVVLANMCPFLEQIEFWRNRVYELRDEDFYARFRGAPRL